MKGRWSLLVTFGLLALGLASLLGWAAVEFFRDPLADLDPLENKDTSPAIADIASPPTADDFHAGYLGSQACVECHSDLCEKYASHPMSRSMSLAHESPAGPTSIRSEPFFAPKGPDDDIRMGYDVTTEGPKVFHNERAYDLAGNEICGRSVEMQYAVGSGQRGHSYLYDAGGYLYMSPITWYTGSRNWDLSPSYEKVNLHFERRILDGCVACHAGRTNPDPRAAHTFDAERPFVELDIGCERCHGPGEAHVDFHKGRAPDDLEHDPIVNPGRLGQPYRNDVCFQCHLSGIMRIIHPGKREYEFRPGQAISDVWTVFIDGTKISQNSTTRAVGQTEQMLASRCYNESAGAMSCTSCHDPHSLPSKAERVDFYRSKCLNCHGEGNNTECSVALAERRTVSPEDSCIDCHMPKLEANNVPHTSQTDHRVIRKTNSEADPGRPPEIEVYESSRLSPQVVDRAKGIFFARQAEEADDKLLANRSIPFLLSWTQQNPNDWEALSALGTSYALNEDVALAIAASEKALAIEPNDEYALRQLMVLYHDLGDLKTGIRYGRRLIEVNPHPYEYHGRMAHMLGQNNQMDEAIESGQRAAALQPWNSQIQGWLADAYRLTHQPKLAEKHQKLYEKLRPRRSQ
jgi:hypothetical protein